MSLRQTLRYFRRVYRASHQRLPHEEEYERLAADALQACSEWFGPPVDPKRPVGYAVSPDNISACGYFFGQYMIALNPNLDTPAERCETIGHEMYHRVTMRRPGLRREMWIDEMMAFLAEQWFLTRHGFGERVRENRRRYNSRKEPADIDALRRFRLRRPLVNTTGMGAWYPPNFYPDVQRLATALNGGGKRNDLARLPWAKSRPAGVESRPADRRANVDRLFVPSTPDRPSPDDLEENFRMGCALHALGRFDEAVARYRAARGRDGKKGFLFFSIALCLERAGHTDEAIDAYREAIQDNPDDEWTFYNLALIYRKRKDYPHAIECFEEALRRKPDWSTALCYLGTAYAKDGQREKALECWRRIIETCDPEWLTWAKEAIAHHRDARAEESRNHLTA